MHVTLYKVSDDINVFNRTKTIIGSTFSDFQANEELAIDAPDIVIEYNASYLECNYVYIEEYSRYYDVTAKTVLNGNIIRLSLLSDVLASFPDIKSSQCIAGRSTSNPNHNLVDPLVSFKPEPDISFTKMSYKFTPTSSGSYILTVGGK